MIVVKEEDFWSTYPEVKALSIYHWLEVTSDQTIVLDLNDKLFEEIYNQGGMRLVAARAEGNLVGYILLILTRPLHYKKTLVAQEDAHYVTPGHRSFSTFRAMVKKAEEVASECGAVMIRFHTKSRGDLTRQKLFERLGYRSEEVIMCKKLGD